MKKYQLLIETLQQDFIKENLKFTEEYITLLKKFAPPEKYPSLLDVGCGEGPQEIDLLEKAGYNPIGISIQKWMVGKKILLMDMHDLQFKPNHFDVICSWAVLEHSYIPWLALMEIYTVLKPSGILCFSVPAPDFYESPAHPTLLTLNQWKRILKDIGFEILYQDQTPPDMLRIIVKRQAPENENMQKCLKALEALH